MMMIGLLIIQNKYYLMMDPQIRTITLKKENLDPAEWTELQKSTNKNQLILEFKNERRKLLAYAYQVKNDLETFKQRLENQVNLYNKTASDCMVKVEDMLCTSIQGTIYIFVIRAFSENLNSLSEVVKSPLRKGGLRILEIILKIVQTLKKLEEISFSHNNLSLQRISYGYENLLIDFPILPTICRQLRSLGYSGGQKQTEADDFSQDVRSLLQIIVGLTCRQRYNMDIADCDARRQQQLLEQIKDQKLKGLVSSILKIKSEGGDCSKVTFKAIEKYLLKGVPLPLVKKKEMDNTQIDILKLKLLNQATASPYRPGNQIIASSTRYLQEYQINFNLYEGLLEITICPNNSPQFKIVAIIKDRNWCHPLGKYIQNAKALLEFIKQQSGRFQITQEGILSYFISRSEATDLQQGLRRQYLQEASESNKFPWNMLGEVERGSATCGRCFLINPRIIVTAASFCFDRQTKLKSQFLECNISGRKYVCKTFAYPKQYETCQEESTWQYNFALAYLEGQPVQRQITPTILLNYHEGLEVDAQSSKDCLVFSIDYSYIDPSQLNVIGNKVTGVKVSVEVGSPIFVKKGERFALAGIKSGEEVGLLFQGDPSTMSDSGHLETFYQYMYDLGASRNEIAKTRFCRYDLFDFGEEQINDTFETVDLMYIEYKLGANQFFGDFPMQLCYLLQKQILTKALYSSKLLKYLQIILNAYQTYFSPSYWKVPYILLHIALTHKNMGNVKEAHSVLENALQFQTQGRSNPNLLAQIYFALGCIYHLTQDNQYAETFYKKSLSLCQKLHNWNLKGKILHNLGQFQRSSQELADALAYLQKAIETKQKFSDESDVFRTIISYASKALKPEYPQQSQQIIQALGKLNDKAKLREVIDRLRLKEALLKAGESFQKERRVIINQFSALGVNPQLDL